MPALALKDSHSPGSLAAEAVKASLPSPLQAVSQLVVSQLAVSKLAAWPLEHSQPVALRPPVRCPEVAVLTSPQLVLASDSWKQCEDQCRYRCPRQMRAG